MIILSKGKIIDSSAPAAESPKALPHEHLRQAIQGVNTFVNRYVAPQKQLSLKTLENPSIEPALGPDDLLLHSLDELFKENI